MRILYRAIANALGDGNSVVLVNILSAKGSTPRSAGAMMAVFQDGSSLGTIGGGNVEYQAQKTAVTLLKKKHSLIQEFHFTPNDAASLGMVCGGDQTILFQYLSADDTSARDVFRELIYAEGGDQDIWLVRKIVENAVTAMGIAAHSGIRFCDVPNVTLPTLLHDQPVYKDGWFSVPVVKAGHVYIFGGGHVAQALVKVITLAGFRTVVFDDRDEFANPELFPCAEQTICGSFHMLRERIRITPDDYVVIMTRGHQADNEVLEQTLRSGAKYIGCIGSRKKLAVCRETLLKDGFSPAEIDAVHAPIGLPIGAETPEEIAISVAAELVAIRAGSKGKAT